MSKPATSTSAPASPTGSGSNGRPKTVGCSSTRRDGQTQPERRRNSQALRWSDPVSAIVADLETAFGQTGLTADVQAFSPSPARNSGSTANLRGAHPNAPQTLTPIGPPLWLLAEITYRCPLHCVFCYNPVDFARTETGLSTKDWLRVLREARATGSVQCGFSGGEPMMRDDLEILVAEAHRLGFYTNLLLPESVSPMPGRAKLKDAGLDHIQLSFQDSTRELERFFSHTRTFELKQRVCPPDQSTAGPWCSTASSTRMNIDYIGQIIEMAVELGAGIWSWPTASTTPGPR